MSWSWHSSPPCTGNYSPTTCGSIQGFLVGFTPTLWTQISDFCLSLRKEIICFRLKVSVRIGLGGLRKFSKAHCRVILLNAGLKTGFLRKIRNSNAHDHARPKVSFWHSKIPTTALAFRKFSDTALLLSDYFQIMPARFQIFFRISLNCFRFVSDFRSETFL